MDMRRTVVLSASAALAVLLLGVAALLLWTPQAQAQEIPCNNNLCIDKTADKSTVEVGQPITFTITERCIFGRACVDSDPLVDQLPSGLTVDSVSRCGTSGNTVTCDGPRFIEQVAPFQLIIVATTTECGTFTNTASAGENSGSATYTVEGCPPPLPTTKAQCKKGGFREFGYPDQGKCVSDVNRRNRLDRS